MRSRLQLVRRDPRCARGAARNARAQMWPHRQRAQQRRQGPGGRLEPPTSVSRAAGLRATRRFPRINAPALLAGHAMLVGPDRKSEQLTLRPQSAPAPQDVYRISSTAWTKVPPPTRPDGQGPSSCAGMSLLPCAPMPGVSTSFTPRRHQRRRRREPGCVIRRGRRRARR